MRRHAIGIKLALVALMLAFIWGNSLLSGEISGQHSELVRQLLEPVIEPVQRFLSDRGYMLEQSYLVRKAAHFTEFFMLGAVMLALFIRPGWKIRSILPAALCLIAAGIDEVIQTFSEGRGPALRDVALDFAGACAGLLLAAAIAGLIRMLRQKKTE